MLVIFSISTYCSLVYIRKYAAYVSLILEALGFIVIMLPSSQFSLSLYKTVLDAKQALRLQWALSVRTFSLCAWRRWEALRGGERRVVTADTLQRYKRTLRVDLPARMCEDLAKCMQIFLRTAPYMPAPKRTHSSAYSGLVAQAGY